MTAGPEKPNRSDILVRVRFQETDLMGIVHHGSYVSYLEVARIEWLRRRGVTYAAWAASGCHLAIVEIALKYRAPSRFDDELCVETTIADVRAASARFEYRIVRPADAVLCAEGSTRVACVDHRQALRRLSPEMIEVLHRSEDPGCDRNAL